MKNLVLAADPDPELWVRVPGTYPDDAGATTPEDWARTVAAGRTGSAEETQRLERLLEDLARGESGREDGTVYLYLPPDGRPMQKVRLRAVLTEVLGSPVLLSPLDPAADPVDAELLGRGSRSVVAGRAHESTDDLLVTVVYRWDLGWLSVLLTMATLEPGAAVSMLPELDDLTHDIWVEDEAGELVTAAVVADV